MTDEKQKLDEALKQRAAEIVGKPLLRHLIRKSVPELPEAAVNELTDRLYVKLANHLDDYDTFGRVIKEELAKVWPQ